MISDQISLSEARRIALAAQGFGQPRPAGRVTAQNLAKIVRRLGLVQIDYVNVLVPAHYLVPFSRLGPYRRPMLDDLVRKGDLIEQWAHEASIVPVESWPLLEHRRSTHRVRPWGFEKFIEKNPQYVQWVLDEVRTRGPLTASDLTTPEDKERRIEGAWFGSVPRAVLEAHFGRGSLAIAERRSNYARVYDLAERVIAAEHHSRQLEDQDAQRELIRHAARAYGIATVRDLADYYRMPARDAQPRVLELEEAGELRPVKVAGWREVAYLHRDAKLPARMQAGALLSPFDPLVWFRPRTLRLFDFHYRLEIYVPEEKRRWGYYVLPFLLGESIVARLDLKADRGERELLVMAMHLEPGAKAGDVAGPLAKELRVMAKWLDLDSVKVESRGALAKALRAALSASQPGD